MPAAGAQNTRERQRRRKPRTLASPSPRQVSNALAQRNQYVSTGRAVGKVANQQRSRQRQRRLSAPGRQYVSTGRAVEHVAAQQRRAAHSFGNPEVDYKNPVLLRRFKAATARGDLIDAGSLPLLGLKNLADVVRSSPNIARAVYEDPLHTAGNTARSIPGLTAAAIAGLVEVPLKVATGHAGDLARVIRDDNRRRYSGSAASQRQRIHREGVAAEAVDIAPALLGAGTVAGEGLSALAKAGRVTRLAEGGSRVAKAFQAPTKARPLLRKAAGEQGAKVQDLSGNYLKAVTQHAVDRGRARKFEQRAGRVDQAGDPVPIRGLLPGPGEVVKKRLVLQRRDQRIAVSKGSSEGFQTQQRLQEREVRAGVERERRKLSKGDQRVETLSSQGLIHFDSPEVTKHLLTAYRERIVAHRKIEADKALKQGRAPHKIPKKSDELARIDETLARLEANPSEVLSPALRDFHALQVDRYHRLRAADNVNATDLTAEVRRYQPLGRVLGEHQALDAATARVDAKLQNGDFGAKTSDVAIAKANVLKDRARSQFVARTRARAESLGVPEPVYVGHRPRAKAEFAPYAPGGAKAVQGTKRSQFKLFDQGRADTTGGAYSDALAQSIKRNVNWNTVADTFHRHTPTWGRNLKSRESALKALDDRGLAHGDWRVVDLGRYRKARDGAGNTEDVGLQGDQHIHDAMKQATYTLDGVPADFASTGRRLSLVPKGVADELEAMTKPSGVVGRTAQKVQGIQSKLILGTNPTFVPVQIAANIPLAALATKVNLRNWLHGHQAWKGLDQPTRDWVESRLGVSSVSSASSFRPRYGAIQNESSALLHNWRVFSDSNAVQGARRSLANPLNWNHRLDDLQNNFFRHAVFKADMGREARGLAKAMDDTRAAAKPLVDVLAMPDGPGRLAALRKAEPQLERMAEHVNDMLGDYSRFTARERKLARTTLLFYPFLRWALKFTFYTLPIKHPLAAAITAKLGQLHREEVTNLLADEIVKAHGGTQAQAADQVRKFAPSYAYGRIYYNAGKLQSIDFSRITPLATQAFDVIPQAGDAGVVHGALKTLLGSFSPLGTSVLKAAIGRDPVTGQPLNVGGHKTPFGLSPRMTTGREGGVVLRDLTNLNPIARTGLRIRDRGKLQGDDLSTIHTGLSANDAGKLQDRAAAQGSTREAVLDAAVPFRKKGELLPGTIYRHAVFDALQRIGELKSGMTKGSPMYAALTARETELKRKIGAIPGGSSGVAHSGPLTAAERREVLRPVGAAQGGPLSAAEKREVLQGAGG